MPEARMSLDETSPSVQTHLEFVQRVIDRMAANNNFSKAWCITVVSAMLVVVADKDKPKYALLALIPTFLFFMLDVYYLALEKGFRNAHDAFVRKLHSGTLTPEDLCSVRPIGRSFELQRSAFCSFSIWGFYLLLTVLVGIAWWVVLP